MKTGKLPGLADVHVHLRVPGGEHKEDFRTGTAAALAGGFTTVLAMPNTQPPLATLDVWRATQQRAQAEAVCDVHLFAGASPDHLGELAALGEEAVALKIYLDQTYGPLRVTSLLSLMECFRRWPREKVIAMHAEGQGIAMGIGLAAAFGRGVHFCHVSRKEEIELIAAAKERGLPVTCEVTPHHLFLSQADLAQLGPLGDMRPRLAEQADVDALWAHINTTVDCIATDHAPHTIEEKLKVESGEWQVASGKWRAEGGQWKKEAGEWRVEREAHLLGCLPVGHRVQAPPGVPGLETALPLMLTAVAEGRLTLERLVALMAHNPRRIYGLPQQPDSWVEVDLDAAYELADESLYTKCGWSPFAGMMARGRVLQVVLRGKIVFQEGHFI